MEILSNIYQQYAPDVYRFALGMCGDPQWAEDLTAETFVRAFVSSTPIRVETVKAYLFTITRNLYLKTWHREQRFGELNDEPATTQRGPEQIVADNDALQFALNGLQQLSEIDRAALLMRAYDGLAYAEIAQTLDISLAATKVKIHRARLKMARYAQELKT